MKPGGTMFSHLPGDFWVCLLFFAFLMPFLVSLTLSVLIFPNLDRLKSPFHSEDLITNLTGH